MALNVTTLATELKKIGNTKYEADVRVGWGVAYTKYMLESTVLGIPPLNASVLATAQSAMQTALIGISTGQTALAGARLIMTAITSYWAAALLAGSTVWVTVPPLVPTPYTLPTNILTPAAKEIMAEALASTFIANTENGLEADAAYDAIALILHQAGTGATVTQATAPSPTPGIPVL